MVGVDEVGRGAIAGSVVAAAVCFSVSSKVIVGVKDSKRLTAKRRRELNKIIRANAVVGIGQIEAKKIDSRGILKATGNAMQIAIESIGVPIDLALIDGKSLNVFGGKYRKKFLIKGDRDCYSIAAASIVAKVFRDKLMEGLSKKYMSYDWHSNKGYGTRKHREAILSYGLTDLHRRTFLSNLKFDKLQVYR